MVKYSFLVYHKEYSSFLDSIKNVGVLDVIKKKNEVAETIKEKYNLIKNINEFIKKLEKIATETTGKDNSIDGKDVYGNLLNINKQIETKQQQLNQLKKEIEQVSPWGDFSASIVNNLNNNNIELRFFVSTVKKFKKEWEQQYAVEAIESSYGLIYFVVFCKKGDVLNIDAEEVRTPEKPVSELQEYRKLIENDIDKLEKEILHIANTNLKKLIEYKESLEENCEYEEVIENTQKEASEKVMLLEGWVPKNKEDEFIEYLTKSDILYIKDKPTSEDRVPILLKNNKFSKLFEPIGGLFSLPDYKELDLTPFFAPFFMMFFGFCLSDAGYGVVIIIGATIAKLKVKPKLKPFMTLAQLLGIGTIIFGVISGTLFGINLIETEIAVFSSFKQYMLDSDKMFNLALILGVIQILFGLCVKAINQTRQYNWQYAMPSFGWIILLLSLLDNYLLELTQLGAIPIYVGLGLIVLFSDPKANIFVRLGKGLWDLYGITGIFGDVLSYIRLFALGISSAILGFVINDISLQIRDGIPFVGWLLFGIFLIVGHTANILISSLGSFVHPMRLTFVEFYKNAGFSGGGKKYKPFKK